MKRIRIILTAAALLVFQMNEALASEEPVTYPPGTTLSAQGCSFYDAWYSKQNRSLANSLLQYGYSASAKGARNIPLSHDTLPADFTQASGFKNPNGAGSGFCGAVFYDPAHNIALTQSAADTTRTVELFVAQSAIIGTAKRDLAQVHTARGVRLGMTPRQVQMILGPAHVAKITGGSGMVYYSRHPQQPPGLYDKVLLGFVKDRLIYIAYFQEFA